MLRRVFFTALALLLAAAAFGSADPTPDVNLFGVLFLFAAFVVWFCWGEIEAGYAFMEDSGAGKCQTSTLMLIRFAPFLPRQLSDKGRP